VLAGIFDQLCRDKRKPVTLNAARYDQDTMVGQIGIEKPMGQPDKIIPVFCHKASLLFYSELKLLKVGCLQHIDFMSTNAIVSLLSDQFD